jgi:transposase, IS5 family
LAARWIGSASRKSAARPGQPPLPTQLMAGLAILKHTFGLSDEQLCARFLEPAFPYFRGEAIQVSLAVAVKVKAMRLFDLREAVVDTTVQEKAVAFPTDAKLRNRARERLVRLARRHGVKLRQSYAGVGKFAFIKHRRYAHARQFKRAKRSLRTLKTYLGRVMRDTERASASAKARRTNPTSSRQGQRRHRAQTLGRRPVRPPRQGADRQSL